MSHLVGLGQSSAIVDRILACIPTRVATDLRIWSKRQNSPPGVEEMVHWLVLDQIRGLQVADDHG